ncbi:MAG: MBL fold metallo-hydrolase [Streptosporangiales bacterium]
MGTLTKLGHACVRVESDDTTVVIDPGVFTAAEVVEGADAVLITHEHPDHFDPDKVGAALRAGGHVRLWAPDSVVGKLPAELASRAQAVRHGSSFDVGGLAFTVYGSDHAVISDDVPVITNVGYLFAGVFHPGDAFTVPDQRVETLLLPINAPWSKVSETMAHVAAVTPARVHPVHDALLTEAGQGVYDPHAKRRSEQVGAEYRRLAIGETVQL